ncbi:MAG: SPOR domain-containing protein, partial [Pseudomonadota bacterium]
QGLEVNEVLAGEAAQDEAPGVAAAPEPVLTDEDSSANELAAAEETPEPAPADPSDPLAAAIDAAIAQVGAEDAAAAGVAEIQDPETQLESSIRPQSRPQPTAPQTDATNTAEASEVAAAPAPATSTGAGRRYQVFPGAQLVQLGAFETETDAVEEWNRLVDENADLLSQRRRYVEPVNSGNRGFYRLRAVGFLTVDEADALCTALKARGIDCIPVVQR